jgi:hypothetical protein
MSQPPDSRLQQALAGIADKVRRFQGRNLGEQNAKASLVEPLLEALGWDVRDPDEVDRELKAATKDAPVDYGLLVRRTPRLLVEAKGLGEDLSDRRWVGQIIGDASVAGAPWCVLTDGDEHRLYNTTVAADAEEKLFCSVRLSAGDDPAPPQPCLPEKRVGGKRFCEDRRTALPFRLVGRAATRRAVDGR